MARRVWSSWGGGRVVKNKSNKLYPTTRNLDEGLKNNNLAKMSKKLCEEAVEALEAAIIYSNNDSHENSINLMQELLDTAQMTLNIINYVNSSMKLLVLESQIEEHNKKLLERGWEWDSNLCMKIVEEKENE